MMHPDQIKTLILAGLPCEHLAIDGDGHGSGPLKLRFSLTHDKVPGGEDRFVFDATATDDQSVGPVNFLMNPGVPGMALGLYFLAQALFQRRELLHLQPLRMTEGTQQGLPFRRGG